MNEEEKTILFKICPSNSINRESLFLYADGELIEKRAPVDGKKRGAFDDIWDKVKPPLQLEDKRLADEIVKIIDDNDQLLRRLPVYLYSEQDELQTYDRYHIQIGNYKFLDFIFGSENLEESFYKKDRYELQIILKKIFSIITKYVDCHFEWTVWMLDKDSFILPVIWDENKFTSYTIEKEEITSPIVFKYYAGLMYWDTEITLYEDGILTEDHPHAFSDQKVTVVYKSLELTELIKKMMNDKVALLQSIPKDFIIQLPYKPLYQTVKFSDFEFTADRLTFPLTEDTKLQGITAKQLYEFQRLFLDIVNLIDEHMKNKRIWDTNLYLNWILFDRAPLFSRYKNEYLVEAVKKYSDRGIDSYTYIGKYPFDGSDIYECNMNDYEEGSCPGNMPYLKIYDYGFVKLIYGDDAKKLKDYFVLEKEILEGKDKGFEAKAIKSYIENEEDMCEKRIMNLNVRTQIERYIRAGWNDMEIAALLKRKVSEIAELRGAL